MSNLPSLRECLNLVKTLEETLEENGGILTEDLETLLQIKDFSLPEKVYNYKMAIQRVEKLQELYEEQEKSIRSSRKAMERASDRMRANLAQAMQDFQINRLTCEAGSISLYETPPSLIIDNFLSIPKEYVTETISYDVDKPKVKDLLKSGVLIEGAHLETKKAVRIK